MKKLKLANILFLLFFSLTGAAQSRQPKELHFNHLFVKDGLPEGAAIALLQDKEGYLWIGTQRGLVRYDGYKPRVYTLGVKNPYDLYISKIYQDLKSRLWVGTYSEGLYEYDRSRDRFIHYPLDTSSSDPSSTVNMVQDIHKDEHGNLWIIRVKVLPGGKYGGDIYLFDPKTGKIIPYGKKEKGDHHINATFFNSLFEDENGSIWAASDNGIYEYNSREDRFMPHLASPDSTQQREFELIHKDASHPNVFWLANASYNYIFREVIMGESGLWRYNTRNDSATVFHHHSEDSHSIASDTIFALQNDDQGRLWIATMQGISLFDPVKQNFINYSPDDGKSKAVIELKKDKNGNFWCVASQGLLSFNMRTKKFIRYTANANDPDGLASNYIHNLYIGKSGTVWFGARQIGLQWINSKRSRFIQYSNKQSSSHYFPGGSVRAFAESKDSTFWIATEHGLYHWQPRINSFTAIKFWQGQKKDPHAWPIMIDEKGYVWFGGGNGEISGLYRYDPETKKTIYFTNHKNDSTSLSNNLVGTLYEDHLKNIWVGTRGGGICRFDRKTQSFIRYPFIINTNNIKHTHGKLDDDEVEMIYEDKKGTLWVGTNNGGLNRFNRNTGKFTSYLQIAPGFQCVNAIYEDHKNRLWAGTYMGGFFRFYRGEDSALRYSEKNGLLYDGVWGILEDQKGNLWLPSSRGISIFNPQTKQVRTLTTANGLPSENLYWTAFKTKKGQFLLATTDGFISLNPNHFTPDPHPPVVHIEAVDFTNPQSRQAKDSTLVAFGKNNIRLHYNENRLTFHYVGLYYQNTALNQYAYKLDGYDKDWVPAGTQRTVTYTNLSPGTYTFHVKAANSDGVWSVKNPSLTLIISPPWWKTWWAYLFYIVIVIAIVWAVIAYRSQQLKRSNEMLEKKVSLRTSQLNESLENLKSTQKQLIQSEKMASLGELTAGIAHEIQNPLNFVNNFSEVNTELIEELKAERLKPKAQRDEELESEILNDIKGNEEKITFHGKRADAIVKGMLQHSRGSSGHKELTDINALADEYLRLSYHGLRAKDKSFNATMKTDLDESIDKINIVPQDIGRVLLNLINNAFYAVSERSRSAVSQKLKAESQKLKAQPTTDPSTSSGQAQQTTHNRQQTTDEDNGYSPTVWVSTKKEDGYVIIKVKDNGNGIPQKALNKIFQPFFTTKPTGEGTGLGLSLSYEIIKVHNGEIKVNTKEGEGTEFIVRLPVA